ncbi:zinc finger protein [Branchiostoma belcheri]|nr:zinc finger protein [Branchiostoma belcheri]
MFTSQAALAKVAPTLALDTAVDCELFGKNFTVVTAIGIPMDMDDNYVRHRLQAYGTIDASRLLTYANLGFPEILSGTRQYRIKLKEHIPDSFRIGNDLIAIRYSGQPKLCHRCGSEEHFVADCTTVKCNKCCEIGHKADVFVNEIKCNIWQSAEKQATLAGPVSTTSEHTKSSGPAETSPTETSSTAKSGDAAGPAEADCGEEQDLEGEEENEDENKVSMGANEEEALPGAGDTAQQTVPKPGTKPPREQVVKSNSADKTKVCKAKPTTTDLPDEAQTLPKPLKGTPESTPLPEEGTSKWMSDTEDTEIAQSADGLDLKLDESGDHISEYSSEDESATKRPLSSPSESSPSESEDSNTTRRPDKKIKKEAGKTAKGTGKVSPLSGNREVSYKTKSAPSSRKRGRKGQVRLATNQTQSIKVILGDFNAKNSNWLASNTTDNPRRQLQNLFLNHGLEQVLHEPTRGGNLLDLIATSHPAKCYQTGTLAPLGDSDHLITAPALTIQASQHSGKRLVWLYDKADIEALHQDIATAPWDINLIFDSMDDIWDSWAKRLNTEDAWATYRRQRNIVTDLTRRAETVYIEDLVNDVETGNTRRFFTYAKSALGKTSTGIPALQVDSVILEAPEAKANALNDFFIKQTDLPGRSDPTPTFQPTTVPESVLDSLQLSEEEVRQQLRTLQVGNYLSDRKQRVVIQGATSAWKSPLAGVPQGGTVLQVVTSHKHLGVTLTNTLSWSQHIEVISTKARRSSGLLCALRRKIPRNLLLRLYITITRPTLEYADIVWAGLTLRDQRTLESVRYQTARLISGHFGIPYPSYNSLYTELSLPSLQFRRKFHTAVTKYKLLNGRCPPHLQSLLPRARASATESRVANWSGMAGLIDRDTCHKSCIVMLWDTIASSHQVNDLLGGAPSSVPRPNADVVPPEAVKFVIIRSFGYAASREQSDGQILIDGGKPFDLGGKPWTSQSLQLAEIYEIYRRGSDVPRIHMIGSPTTSGNLRNRRGGNAVSCVGGSGGTMQSLVGSRYNRENKRRASETERSMMKARFSEHRRPSSSRSEVSQHIHIESPGHTVTLDKVRILDTEQDYFVRGVNEAVYIRAHQPSLTVMAGDSVFPWRLFVPPWSPPTFNALLTSSRFRLPERQRVLHSSDHGVVFSTSMT